VDIAETVAASRLTNAGSVVTGSVPVPANPELFWEPEYGRPWHPADGKVGAIPMSAMVQVEQVWLSDEPCVLEVTAALGVPVNYAAPNGLTAAHAGALNGDVKVLAVLKERDVAMDTWSCTVPSPLHLPALRGHAAAVEWLVAEGGVSADALCFTSPACTSRYIAAVPPTSTPRQRRSAGRRSSRAAQAPRGGAPSTLQPWRTA
jgi:hypothetical protein